jgi:colicin import membrane protein
VKAEGEAYEKPRQPGRIRAILLAIGVHAAFFALIVFGVTWQNRPQPPLEAELWDKLPAKTTAAPKVEPEPPKPDPPKPEPPKPEPPKPEPPKPEPIAKPEPPRPDPAIAEKKERAEREKRERLEKQRQDEAKKARDKDEADKKKKQQDAKAKSERDKELAEAAKAQEAANALKRTDFNRYVDAIRNKIRGKANVPDNVAGRPSVQVRITILPGGDVLNVVIAKSSGNPAYDAAIERAIRSAQPLPVPAADSELFPQFRDLILNIEHDR